MKREGGRVHVRKRMESSQEEAREEKYTRGLLQGKQCGGASRIRSCPISRHECFLFANESDDDGEHQGVVAVEAIQFIFLIYGLATTIVNGMRHVIQQMYLASILNLEIVSKNMRPLSLFQRFRIPLDAWDQAEIDYNKIVWLKGTVFHARLQPKTHQFKYFTRMALVNIDNPPTWFFSSDKTSTEWMTSQEVKSMVGMEKSDAYDVWLLCMPMAAGYIINPIAIYYLFPKGDKPNGLKDMQFHKLCVAEVTSEPWGDKVRFTFHANGDIVPKCLHVSPFMKVQDMNWRIRTQIDHSNPRLSVTVIVNNGDCQSQLGKQGDSFKDCLNRMDTLLYASLVLYEDTYQYRAENLFAVQQHAGQDSVELRKIGSFQIMLHFGFQPHRACTAIYINALLLLFKGLIPFSHPPFKSLLSIIEKHKNTDGAKPIEKLPPPPWPWGVY